MAVTYSEPTKYQFHGSTDPEKPLAPIIDDIDDIASGKAAAEATSTERKHQDVSARVISSTDPQGHTYPDGGAAACLVCFGCFCTFFSSLAIMNSLGTYSAYLSTHQLAHIPPSTIAWIFGLYTFIAFFAGVQVGPWFDAYGPRPLSLLGSIGLLASYGLVGLCSQFWHFLLCISLLSGLATSLLFTAAVCTVQHWFYARRGLATGLAVSGGSLAGIMFPLILEALFSRIGFAWATRVKALILLPFTVAGCLLMKPRFSSPKTRRLVLPDLSMLLTPRIATMVAGIFLMEWGLFIPITYISSYALKEGMTPQLAYNMLTFLNVGSLFGRWLPGYAADRVGHFNTQILAVLLCCISISVMWKLAAGSVAILVTTAVVFGFASGSNISLTPVCLAQVCEIERFGRFYAAAYTVSSFGALTGIPIGGALLDAAGGEYWGVIAFGGATYMASLLCFVAVRVSDSGWNLRKKF